MSILGNLDVSEKYFDCSWKDQNAAYFRLYSMTMIAVAAGFAVTWEAVWQASKNISLQAGLERMMQRP